eukprot:1724537-Pyramimonas_sp.AAC.2
MRRADSFGKTKYADFVLPKLGGWHQRYVPNRQQGRGTGRVVWCTTDDGQTFSFDWAHAHDHHDEDNSYRIYQAKAPLTTNGARTVPEPCPVEYPVAHSDVHKSRSILPAQGCKDPPWFYSEHLHQHPHPPTGLLHKHAKP